jgi:phage recombination protein Bet
MSNALTTLTSNLAKQFNMGDGTDLANTLKATCFKGSTQVTDAQMTALLVVAQQYGLNPFTRELFAFPDKGGIVPVVGVDGWARIINSHQQFDGMDFEQNADSCTCIIYRKDRSHPTRVTEWMAECKRNVGPWLSHPYRMLRHKSMIQAARLAFGFVGIYEQDEAERIVEATSRAPQMKRVDPETGEVSLPDYSDEQFAKNLPAWRGLIESGKKSSDQIIAMVSSKARLNEDQVEMIRATVVDVTAVEEVVE